MNGKQLSTIMMILLVSNASCAMQEGNNNKYKKETMLGRAVTNHPFLMLAGGYLLVKDFVQCQLKVRAPHIIVMMEEGREIPAICPRIDFYRDNPPQKMLALGRYRNMGVFIVASVLLGNMSFSKKDEQLKIDLRKH